MAVVFVFLACDPNAKAKGQADSVARRQLSGEYESCASSLDCQPGLRCGGGVCRSPRTSPEGDYYAASAARALERGDVKIAVEQYANAVERYRAMEMEPPLDLYCAQGDALTASRTNPEHAELAARVLHRCILGMPIGSDPRRRGLANLAILGEVGLDPALLSRPTPGDRYIRERPVPPADSVQVTFTGTVKPEVASYSDFLAAITAAKPQLLPCWEAYVKAARKPALSVTFAVKQRFYEGMYETEDRHRVYVTERTAPRGPGGPEAYACVGNVLSSLVEEFRGSSGRWDGDLTIRLGPAK